MQHKDERSWMLHNVLAAANLPPVSTAYNVDDANIYALIKEPAIPKLPALTGPVTTLALPQCGGLPSDLTSDERKALRLAIIQAVVRGLIVWEEVAKYKIKRHRRQNKHASKGRSLEDKAIRQ